MAFKAVPVRSRPRVPIEDLRICGGFFVLYSAKMSESKFNLQQWFEQKDEPLIIAGPCSVESEQQFCETAKALAFIGRVNVLRGGLWKPRTQPNSFEGLGSEGIQIMLKAKQQSGMPIATEVATPQHIEQVLKAGFDAVWIGARTVVNPFSVQELATSLRGCDIPVFIKNPVVADLKLWIGASERFANAGISHMAGIHRGFHSYGESEFRNAPAWDLAIEFSRLTNLPVITDVSHMCGKPELLQATAQKALDLASAGLMIESHICPACALSDAQQQITPDQLKQLIDSLVIRSNADTDCQQQLQLLRSEIDKIDSTLLNELAQRMHISQQIGELKRANNMTVVQMNRWKQILEDHIAHGNSLGLSPEFVAGLFELIHQESIKQQIK